MEVAMILAAIDGVSRIIELIGRAIANAKQNAELTPAEEALLDAKLAALKEQPWWKAGK